VRRWGLAHVLLVRGDAQRLPLADESLAKVHCSGGFHQLPDLPQALAEIARVSAPGAVLTASTYAEGPHDRWAGLKRWLGARYALRFVPLIWPASRLAPWATATTGGRYRVRGSATPRPARRSREELEQSQAIHAEGQRAGNAVGVP